MSDRKRLGGNVIVGVANSAATAILSVLVVPILLRILGPEGYGLVTIFVTVQALFLVLDFGLAPTINREVAASYANGSLDAARNLLHTFSVIYWIATTCGATAMLVIAPFIASNWVHSRTLDSTSVTEAIRLMGLAAAVRLPNGLYLGAAMGAQQFAKASLINLAAGALSTAGAVVALLALGPSLRTYFVWQLLIATIQVLAGWRLAWRHLPGDMPPKFDVNGLRRTWKFSMGLALAAILGSVVMQLDRLLLPRFVPLAEVGVYGVAGLLARSLMIIISPMFGALYPHFTLLAAQGDDNAIIELYRGGTRLVSAIVFPVTVFGVICGGDAVAIWTNGRIPSLATGELAALLLFGMSLNGVMYFPHALQLAFGKGMLPVWINVAMLAFGLPALLILVPRYGAMGGAYAWVGMNVVNLLAGTWLTHRSIFRDQGLTWLINDVLAPMLLSGIAALLGLAAVRELHAWAPRLIVGVFAAAGASAAVVAFSPQMKATLRRLVSGGRRV